MAAAFGGYAGDSCAPIQGGANLGRPVDQQLMQNRAPNSIANAMGKFCLNVVVVVKEANAAKRRCLPGTYLHAKLAKRRQAVRHDALATRFIDGRLRAVNDSNLKTRLPNGDGSRQSSGTAAGNQHFSLTDRFGHRLYHRNSTSSEQKPGPMAARML